jgi:hypothetical protein
MVLMHRQTRAFLSPWESLCFSDSNRAKTVLEGPITAQSFSVAGYVSCARYGMGCAGTVTPTILHLLRLVPPPPTYRGAKG